MNLNSSKQASHKVCHSNFFLGSKCLGIYVHCTCLWVNVSWGQIVLVAKSLWDQTTSGSKWIGAFHTASISFWIPKRQAIWYYPLMTYVPYSIVPILQVCSTSFPNATLTSCPLFSLTFVWVCCCFAVAPTQKWVKKSGQLVRVAFVKNLLLTELGL